MHSLIRTLRLRNWSVSARLLLINGSLMAALVIVSIIAWRAVSAQTRAMAELALISKAARYHQDADTVHANLRAEVNAALASGILSENDRAKVTNSLSDNAQDFRRDLATLERFDLAPDLVETGGQGALIGLGDRLSVQGNRNRSARAWGPEGRRTPDANVSGIR